MPHSSQTYSVWPEAEKAACFSAATRTGDLLFIAGTISVDKDFNPLAQHDMQAQLENVYRQIGKTLADHGVGFDAVMKETIFVTDLQAFGAANQVRVDAYSDTRPPAAAAVQVAQLWYPGIMVEIEAIADLSKQRKA